MSSISRIEHCDSSRNQKSTPIYSQSENENCIFDAPSERCQQSTENEDYRSDLGYCPRNQAQPKEKSSKSPTEKALELKAEAKPNFANRTFNNVHYNKNGYIDKVYNSQGQVVKKSISRTPAGELTGYVDVSYSKDGYKTTESLYSITNGKPVKDVELKFNGDGTATETQYDRNGKAVSIIKYETSTDENGEERAEFRKIIEYIKYAESN